jgi:hypothetical protein
MSPGPPECTPQGCYPAIREQRRTLPIAVSPPVPDRSSWIVLAVVSVAQFMVVLDARIVNVALPSLQRDLRFVARDLQRAGTLYTLLFGGFLLLGGRAADLFGRRRLVMAGVAVFSAASRTESATASGRPRAPGADSPPSARSPTSSADNGPPETARTRPHRSAGVARAPATPPTSTSSLSSTRTIPRAPAAGRRQPPRGTVMPPGVGARARSRVRRAGGRDGLATCGGRQRELGADAGSGAGWAIDGQRAGQRRHAVV